MALAILTSAPSAAPSAGSPLIYAADAATAMPDLSRYPCTVPSSTGISLMRLDRKTSGEYVLTFSMPLDEASFFRGYAYDTSTFASTQTVTLLNGARAIVAIPQYRAPTHITWDSNGRRYVIALGVPHFPEDLVAMANSTTTF